MTFLDTFEQIDRTLVFFNICIVGFTIHATNKFSRSLNIISDTSIVLPSCLKHRHKAWVPFHAPQWEHLPFLTKELVVSQPVNECTGGIIEQIFASLLFIIAFTLSSLLLSPVPVSNNIDCSIACGKLQ